MALTLALLFIGCQSDEEKAAEFYAKGLEYDKEEKSLEAVIEFKNVLKINPNHADAHYDLSKSYMKLGRARDAYWEMSETVRLDPDNVEAALSFGALSLVAGDAEQAYAMGELATKKEPENHQGHVLTGRALQKLDRDEEAEPFYLRAVELEPEDSDLMLTVAGYYAGLPDGREKAEPWFWRTVEKFPMFKTRTALARFLIQDENRFDEAEAMFKETVETTPRRPNLDEAYLNLSRFYFSTKRDEDAVATLRAGTEAIPESTELLFMLATYYRLNGKYPEADELIRKATQIDESDPVPFLVLSAFLGGRQDLEGALAAADSAIAADSENVDAKLRRAELLVDIGFRAAGVEAAKTPEDNLIELANANEQIREGLETVEAILAVTPFHPQAEFVRGKAYLAKGDPDKGIDGFRKAAEGRPDWAQAHFALGSALASVNQPTLARVEIARALELDGGMIQARRVLASIHQILGEHEYAIEQGNLFLNFRPEHNETRVLVAQSLIRLGKRKEALRELNKVPADQRDAGVLFALGRVHANLGDSASARGYLLQVLELSEDNPKVLRTLFKIDRDDKTNYAQTRDFIIAAAERNPDDGDLLQLEGMVKLGDKDFEGAEAAFKRATEVNPDDIDAHQQLARFYSITGRTDETIATYQRAIEVKPTSARLHHFLALLYEAQGKLDKAQASYENAIKFDDNHAFAKNNLAYLLADNGKDLDRALDLAQDAKELLPNDANAADTLGWVLYKRGVHGAAVGYLKESVENADVDDPALGVMRHHLALAYEADGNKEQAAKVLRTAISDLEERQRAIRSQGKTPQSPPWESEVRGMLDRLSAS